MVWILCNRWWDYRLPIKNTQISIFCYDAQAKIYNSVITTKYSYCMITRHTPFGLEFDQQMMQEALFLAQKALHEGEVPIGAVVIDATGAIIGRGYNTVERDFTQTSHAECHALKEAGKHVQSWRLTNFWIYVTLEPCVMCVAAITLSRCAGIVYGADSPLFGFSHVIEAVSWVQQTSIAIISGVKQQESAALLQEFFKSNRQKKGGRNGK